MDPAKDAHALAPLLDRLADLDARRGRRRLDEDDLLGVLELLELRLALGRPRGLVALPELLLPGDLLQVPTERLLGLFDRRGRRRLPRVRLALLGDLLERRDAVAVRDVGPKERLVRVRDRAVARGVGARRLVDVERLAG